MKKKILLVILAVILLAAASFLIWRSFSAPTSEPETLACTQEARLCGDGSYVGRTGPDCSFAPCPEIKATTSPVTTVNQVPAVNEASWKTLTERQDGLTFKYPENLPASYISTAEWPPKITVATGTFACPETSATASLPSRVMKSLVGGTTYCIEAMSEGAAGSVYTSFTYTTDWNDKLIRIEFTLRYPQCLNYDDPNRPICQKERESFDLDNLVNSIVQSLKETGSRN